METAVHDTLMRTLRKRERLDIPLEGREASPVEVVIDEGKTKLERAHLLGRILRQLGSALLILSSIAFLVQRWGILDHVSRYFSFLGFTVTMAAAGLFCGIGMKESKGARTLLALVAGLASVHFAQLGALLYSRFSIDGFLTKYPPLLTWVAPDEISAVLTVAAGLVVLTPLLYLAFSALDRQLAKRLTATMLAVNALFLVPTRAPEVIGVLALAAICGVLLHDRKLKELTRFATFENRLARFLPCIAPVVMIGRQLLLYPVSLQFDAMMLLALTVAMFVMLPQYLPQAVGSFFQALSIVPLIGGWGCAAASLQAPDFAVIPLFLLPLCGSLLAMGMLDERRPGLYFGTAALFALAGMCIQLKVYPGLVASAMSVIVVTAALAISVLLERKGMLTCAVLAAIYTLVYHVNLIMLQVHVNLWLTLGVAGVSVIVGASFIERHYGAVLAAVGNARRTVASWKV